MDASSDHPVGYLLTKLGQVVTARFADHLKELGIRPKHYGLLVAIDAMPARSQADIGAAVGVVPSAVVGMLDDLELLGAVVRVADPQNRRRFGVELTDAGRRLLGRATELGGRLDDEILASLREPDRRALSATLATLAADLGILPAGSAAPARL
jgi:DNA-binding MarR family transcriptional regulator